MSRQIVLDTETTGLLTKDGHRIVEIAALEMMDGKVTGKVFHEYVNPGRDSDPEALSKHGITTEFLRDKPTFKQIIPAFVDFVKDAEIIIHNAPFDTEHLHNEFTIANQRQTIWEVCGKITDSLAIAKKVHPGKRNSLDVLADRYGIDRTHRVLHGALIDCEILADVYLEMVKAIDLSIPDLETDVMREPVQYISRSAGSKIAVVAVSEQERALNDKYLKDIGGEEYVQSSGPQEEDDDFDLYLEPNFDATPVKSVRTPDTEKPVVSVQNAFKRK